MASTGPGESVILQVRVGVCSTQKRETHAPEAELALLKNHRQQGPLPRVLLRAFFL
jgi:hypothetical protein